MSLHPASVPLVGSFYDGPEPFRVLIICSNLRGAGRAEKLRREIELIQQKERCYRDRKIHSFSESAEHDKREFRVLAIREELRTLVEGAKQQSRHGSVWYS
jgi:hypothetical protein